MSTLARWGLIGFGNIGHEIIRQLKEPGVAARLGLSAEPVFIVTSRGVLGSNERPSSEYGQFTDIQQFPDVTFVALPSSDDGQMAYDYIAPILKAGKRVVTAEKGALVNHFAKLRELSDDFRRFGVTATVGGGTRLLQVAREYSQDIDNITEIHLALNGTLAAMLGWMAPLQGKGISMDAAARRAVEHKYAEPGSDSPAAIIKAEAEGDIPKKLSIFYNSTGLGREMLDWHDLRFSLTEAEIEQACAPEIRRRFIVSLYSPAYLKNAPAGFQPDADTIGGFSLNHEGWQLVGGFRRVDSNPLFTQLANLIGPGNGIVIGLGPEASDGVYTVTGPGAGVNPTVNTMLDDYVRLKRLQV